MVIIHRLFIQFLAEEFCIQLLKLRYFRRFWRRQYAGACSQNAIIEIGSRGLFIILCEKVVFYGFEIDPKLNFAGVYQRFRKIFLDTSAR